MATETFTIATGDGSAKKITGHIVGPFGIRRARNQCWRLVHLRSGCCLGPRFELLADAREAARKLSDSADWEFGAFGLAAPTGRAAELAADAARAVFGVTDLEALWEEIR